MKELNFESGLVTYSLNGKCEVSFNPTDSNFIERLYPGAYGGICLPDLFGRSNR